MATADLAVIALGRADASAYIAETQRRLAAQDRVGMLDADQP